MTKSYVEGWTQISLDDFSILSGADGWSFTSKSICPQNQNLFLGGHCLLSNQNVFKVFTNLPEHSKILVTANVHFIDNWDGETCWLKLDDSTILWEKSVTAIPGLNYVNSC